MTDLQELYPDRKELIQSVMRSLNVKPGSEGLVLDIENAILGLTIIALDRCPTDDTSLYYGLQSLASAKAHLLRAIPKLVDVHDEPEKPSTLPGN